MKLKDFKVSQEEFIEYYLTHSWEDICKHFNITKNNIKKLIKLYNLSSKRSSFKLINEDIFLDYSKQHSVKDICKHFDISNANYVKLKHLYKLEYKRYSPEVSYILNNLDEFNDYRKKHNDQDIYIKYNISNNTLRRVVDMCGLDKVKYNKAESLESVIQRIDKKEFIDYYNTHSYIDISKHFNISYRRYNDLLHYFDIKFVRSYLENSVKDYLLSLGIDNIESNRRDLLPSGLEMDLYLPDFKLGIEINGDYWHSSLYKEKKYHYNKSIEAEKVGIHLVHIWEHEWEDPHKQELLKTMLGLFTNHIPNRIYARQCEIKNLTNTEAKPFNDANHLQGHRNAQITYGLFYQGQLVQLMSFSKTKYNRNLKGSNDWEIIRGCPGSLNLVVGGVSKLFAHFIKEQNPDKVFSYCDFNKFTGVSYEKLGMKFIGYTGPDKKWLLEEGVIPRQPKRYKELKARAIAELWGSGSKKYLWEKQGSDNA